MEVSCNIEYTESCQNKGQFEIQRNQQFIFEKYKLGLNHAKAPFKLYRSNLSTSDEDRSLDDLQNFKKIRGPYRKYTLEQKTDAVQRVMLGQDVKIISKQFGIPRRNLLRWKRNGCERKEGGGRPTDLQMEKIIYDKITNQELVGYHEIRKFAIELSKANSFKASKGWFVKFCNRFNLNLRTNILKQNNDNDVSHQFHYFN